VQQRRDGRIDHIVFAIDATNALLKSESFAIIGD